MKKHISIIITVTILFILNGCTDISQYNINEFTENFNSISQNNLTMNDYTVIKEDCIIYRTITDNCLISIYTENNGTISQCTVTSKKNNNSFEKISLFIVQTYTGFNSETSKKIIENPSENGFYIKTEDYSIGKTMIIKKSSSSITEIPTLKEKVIENKIQRPKISERIIDNNKTAN